MCSINLFLKNDELKNKYLYLFTEFINAQNEVIVSTLQLVLSYIDSECKLLGPSG